MNTNTGSTLIEPAEQGPGARVVLVLRAQDALDDGLVGAPVPDAQGRVAEENRVPRQAGLLRRRAQHGQFEHLAAGGQLLRHAVPATGLRVGQRGDDTRAGEQDHGLNRLGPDDGRESAENRVDGRQRS